MENDELKELLQNDVPEVDYDSKVILQRCKQENNKFRIHKQKLSFVLSSLIFILIIVFGIIFIYNKNNKEIRDINNAINNLEKIESDETRMLEIMKIENEVATLSDAKRNSINLSKLSFETKNAVNSLKKDASWNEYFDESSDYYKLDSLIIFDDVKRLFLSEGMFSSIKTMYNDNSFINSMLSQFDSIPYVVLSYNEEENFFEKYYQELRGNTSNWRNYDTIDLYNNQFDNDGNVTNLLDFVCTFHISPSGYVILYVPVFDNETEKIIDNKKYISLVPINHRKYTFIKDGRKPIWDMYGELHKNETKEEFIESITNKYAEYINKANQDLKEQYELDYEIKADCCYGVCNEALVFYKLGYPNFTDPFFADFGYGCVQHLLNCVFGHSKTFSFMVWKDGRFYTLNQDGTFKNIENNNYELSEDDRLTEEFIYEMAEIHIRFFYKIL